MRPEEYALWDVSRKLSHETGVLYFDGREMAKRFKATSKNRMYRAARGLVEQGWFDVIADHARDKRTGLYSCSRYRVLSAEDWATKHPHDCVTLPASSPEIETGTSPQNGTGIQSRKEERPVPITGMTSPQNGTYSVKENYVGKEGWMDARSRALGFLEELLKRDTGRLYTLTGKERGQLLEHMEGNDPTLIVAAFLAFLNRPEELSGLKKPYSLFIGQLREWLGEVTGQRATNLAEYFDTELSIQRGLRVPSFLMAGAELVKFQCELIDWNMNFVRIWRAMSAEERKALDDWENANLDGQIGTSDWPGWEGMMPLRPLPPKHCEISTAAGGSFC